MEALVEGALDDPDAPGVVPVVVPALELGMLEPEPEVDAPDRLLDPLPLGTLDALLEDEPELGRLLDPLLLGAFDALLDSLPLTPELDEPEPFSVEADLFEQLRLPEEPTVPEEPVPLLGIVVVVDGFEPALELPVWAKPGAARAKAETATDANRSFLMIPLSEQSDTGASRTPQRDTALTGYQPPGTIRSERDVR